MKKQLFTTIYIFFAFIIFANFAYGKTYFTVEMFGSQIVPPTSSSAKALLVLEMNDTGLTRGRLQGIGIPSSGNTIRVQCPSITFEVIMTTSFYFRAPGTGSEPEISDLRNGRCFFKIITTAFPEGEIGGYAKVATPHLAYIDQNQFIGPQRLYGSQSGNAAILLSNIEVISGGITYKKVGVFFNLNINPVQSVGLYHGRPGENGLFRFNINSSDYFNGALPVFGESILEFTSLDITKLKSGQMYMQATENRPEVTLQNSFRGQFHRQRSVVMDFDGDSKTDFVVTRENKAANAVNWFTLRSSDSGFTSFSTSNASHFETSLLTPNDFDGDGKDDISYWENGTFYIWQSSNNTLRTESFGIAGDNQVVDDFDGDGRADIAVFRNSGKGIQANFYYKGSSNNPSGNITFVPWGLGGDYASSGDFDGDGRADFVVQRPTSSGQSQFWILKSSGGYVAYAYGFNTDITVPGDYDGDGKNDLCVTRLVDGRIDWYILNSSNGSFSGIQFGLSTANQTQGDYDGDGKTDISVTQLLGDTTQRTFWVYRSSDGIIFNMPWGLDTDRPVNGYNIY
jgi:hypothetical protein